MVLNIYYNYFCYDKTLNNKSSSLFSFWYYSNNFKKINSINITNDEVKMGKLNLKTATNLVLGGWNKHAGLTGPTDGWISGFSGKMDQFRLYGKVLTASEITALYNSKL